MRGVIRTCQRRGWRSTTRLMLPLVVLTSNGGGGGRKVFPRWEQRVPFDAFKNTPPSNGDYRRRTKRRHSYASTACWDFPACMTAVVSLFSPRFEQTSRPHLPLPPNTPSGLRRTRAPQDLREAQARCLQSQPWPTGGSRGDGAEAGEGGTGAAGGTTAAGAAAGAEGAAEGRRSFPKFSRSTRGRSSRCEDGILGGLWGGGGDRRPWWTALHAVAVAVACKFGHSRSTSDASVAPVEGRGESPCCVVCVPAYQNDI